MTTYQPATPHSNAIMRPDCAKCKTGMRLFGIEPEGDGFEVHTFVCPKCKHVRAKMGQAEQIKQ